MHAVSPLAVDLAGYLDASSGLGAAARNVREALEHAGVAVTPIALAARGEVAKPGGRGPGHVTLVCVSPEGMAGAREALQLEDGGRRVIGLWWWEVGVFPGRWRRAFDGVDEVWVGSRFMADLLAPVSPVPVVRVPTPVPEPRPDPLSREELGLPGGYLFGFVFDHGSVTERKHPVGLITAFRRAFGPDEDVGLVIKAMGGERHPDAHARLLEAAAGDPRILVIDSVMPAGRKDALLAALDCFVSLHRSEGFGLPIAEAMLLGKPVIATDHGGARDLLTAFNSYPVDHRPVRVGPGHEPYPADAEWAEPDLDHAVALLRRVKEHPEEARARGARAREDVLREHAPAVAGRAMEARLRSSVGLVSPDAVDRLDTRDLERRLRQGPEYVERSLSPVRRALRTAVLRAIRPYGAHQRMVDEEVLRTLRTMDERLRGAIAGQQALAARVRELERAEGGAEPVSPSSTSEP